MLWIIYVGTEVPEYLKHDPNISTDRGETCDTFRKIHMRTLPGNYKVCPYSGLVKLCASP